MFSRATGFVSRVAKTLVLALAYTILGLFDALLPRRRKFPDLSADICLVTGAGGGLGRELARKFAFCGATLVLWDINLESIQTVAEEIRADGGEAHAYACDCSKKEEVYSVAERVKADVGNVAILVNNAGIVTGKKIVASSCEEMERVFQVNTLAHFWTVKAFLPWMKENNYGNIVSIASVLAFGSVAGVGDYAASKAAALSFAESLHFELLVSSSAGVKVTCVCPYLMDTGMFAGVRTRLPFLFGPVKSSVVADHTISAVSCGKFLVILPRWFHFLVFLSRILPLKALDELSILLGASEAMNTFKN